MTVVLVHGVPETTQVWDPLVVALAPTAEEEFVRLALPGFGCDLPEGFHPDMETYARWFAEQIAPYEQVDLVTHDWGAILALRVLADRPANVRSWVSDMGDLGADFRWHDTALVWQTPGDGEALIDAMVAAPLADRAALLAGVGVPADAATAMAEHLDARMGAAILVLYRSATDVGNDWGPGIDDIDAPGLLIESMLDPFRSAGRVGRLAERTGAQIAHLAESGHFWMLDAPDAAAAAIRRFWASVPAA